MKRYALLVGLVLAGSTVAWGGFNPWADGTGATQYDTGCATDVIDPSRTIILIGTSGGLATPGLGGTRSCCDWESFWRHGTTTLTGACEGVLFPNLEETIASACEGLFYPSMAELLASPSAILDCVLSRGSEPGHYDAGADTFCFASVM